MHIKKLTTIHPLRPFSIVYFSFQSRSVWLHIFMERSTSPSSTSWRYLQKHKFRIISEVILKKISYHCKSHFLGSRADIMNQTKWLFLTIAPSDAAEPCKIGYQDAPSKMQAHIDPRAKIFKGWTPKSQALNQMQIRLPSPLQSQWNWEDQFHLHHPLKSVGSFSNTKIKASH